ncbi:hypothetical protein O181_050971, partial [Austropuccinia psidii MF-1]|nr:hypothetical protein [Austropuccinia psidii MF-1]
MNKSPYLLWTNQPPQIERLRTFGCLAFIANPRNHHTWKMGPAGVEGILLGYENKNTAYHILRISDAKVIVTKHEAFDKGKFPSITEVSEGSHLNLNDFTTMVGESEGGADCSEMVDEIQMNSFCKSSPSIMVDEVHGNGEGSLSAKAVTAPITSVHIRVIRPFHPSLVSSDINSLNILPYTMRADALLTLADSSPCTYKEALNAPEKELWLAAIKKELNSMDKLQVWEVAERHRNFKLIGTTWVFRLKKDHSNWEIAHKARLCAQAFTQTQGFNFEKTYTPTGHLNSLQTLIAFAAEKGLKFHQIDIKSAFLNSPLLEEFYLHIPQGVELNEKRWCLRLKKAIYGLKQAPLAWYKCMKEWLVGANFQACILDPCVFHWEGIKPIWLYLHVNDIAVFGNEISEFKEEISLKFEIKVLCPVHLLLWVKITQEADCIYLDQQHFCELFL